MIRFALILLLLSPLVIADNRLPAADFSSLLRTSQVHLEQGQYQTAQALIRQAQTHISNDHQYLAHQWALAGLALHQSEQNTGQSQPLCLIQRHLDNAVMRAQQAELTLSPQHHNLVTRYDRLRADMMLDSATIDCVLQSRLKAVGVAPRLDLHIQFDTASAVINAAGLAQSRELAQALRVPAYQDYQILLVGHTDSRGSDRYNLALSERRALAVKTHLIQVYDFPPAVLITEGQGESQLKISPERSPLDWQVNRRVEITLVRR